MFRIALCGLFFGRYRFFYWFFRSCFVNIQNSSSSAVQLDIKGAFHFPRNSANSGWDANGTHVFQAFQWKVARNKWNFEKIVLFPVGNFPVEMHGPFTSFHKESPVPGYAGLNLSRQLEFW